MRLTSTFPARMNWSTKVNPRLIPNMIPRMNPHWRLPWVQGNTHIATLRDIYSRYELSRNTLRSIRRLA
ncbi:MAG: hypothetical protein JWQ81_953 [Amycolatopsis sp.]|nr:hypothetical protein [Amycolatopsis sp.]